VFIIKIIGTSIDIVDIHILPNKVYKYRDFISWIVISWFGTINSHKIFKRLSSTLCIWILYQSVNI